ncbi:MAG TPA: VWA domain-containing protein [Casimicrobiaceae bacterium]|nr:VWA domain-containing protein [Casimicrobiaceae bacterium]
MSFLWPQALWLLLAAPALVALYIFLLRRKKKNALRYASLGLVREALGPRQRFRRHVPPLLFLLAMIALIVAIARPSATITLPSEQRTIILAVDVSLSMRANDVEPSRIEAARTAAKTFVREQPSDVRIGIVSFAGSASVVQKPTRDRDELIAAIDRLQLQLHTAIGSGIIMSLATLFPDEGLELAIADFGVAPLRDGTRAKSLDRPRDEKKEFNPVPPGSNRSAAIILLTDGRRTIGPDPLEAAQMAADRGVKVYAVGFGKAGGGTATVDGMPIYMRFDEETLKAIAALTEAEYFQASSAAELKKVYETLNARYVLEKKETEISALASALGALLVLAAAALSLWWTHRIV